MSAEPPAFVDTNILVYAFEREVSPRKLTARSLVSRLMAEDRLRISTQVLQELFVVLTRKVKRPCTAEQALLLLEDLAAWPLFVVDLDAIRAAGELTAGAGLSFWDALVVVAAARSGASVLYTEDLNHGRQLLGVRITNPFAEG